MKNKSLVIVDGGGANFTSIQAALSRLGVLAEITSDAKVIQGADYVILPGVGAAGYAMKLLREKNLTKVIKNLSQPVLGICLGEQLLCSSSEENNTQGMDIIPLRVNKLTNIRVIPHMGWNTLENIDKNDPLLKGISSDDNFYFVHSFAAEIKQPYTLCVCNYGVQFSAVIKKNNFYGVQFHPEKSGKAGERILQNFLNIPI